MARTEEETRAEVIDLTAMACDNCGAEVTPTQHFCAECGSRLEELPPIAPISEPLPPDAVDAPQEASRRSRRKLRVVVLSIAGLLVAAVAGTALWLATRPDLSAFDSGLRRSERLASDVQVATDSLRGEVDFSAFQTALSDGVEAAGTEERAASSLPADYRDALTRVTTAESRYFEEMDRLASLPPATSEVDFTRASQLAQDVEEAFADALALRDVTSVSEISVSPNALSTAISQRADLIERIRKRRARIISQNHARAEKLSDVQAFAGQMDGIIDRYSTARAELSNWIDGVNAHGASFNEAYQVLAQQADRRRQLRDELSALVAPDDFAADKEALLSVIDQAVDATEAASRGISEYEFSYSYYSYDETPGWRTFEDATDSISDTYASAISTYEAKKADLVNRLSKKKPLPKLPDLS